MRRSLSEHAAGRHPMEALHHHLLLPTGLPWPEIIIALAAGAIIYIFYRYTVVGDGEDAVPDLNVPVPEQCEPGWQGELLDEPSIKVVTASVKGSESNVSDHGGRYPAQVLYNVIVQLLEGC